MPNIQSLLKSEIARIARKEVRAETERLKKSSTSYRSQIASLKRSVAALEKQLNRQRGAAAAPAFAAGEEEERAGRRGFRFSAKGLAAQRRRLGLSAREVALLLGVSSLSVYKWEQGKARPRAKQMEAISQLRRMGKKEAAARLSEVEG
jgi:DNA-binding transcriptional regulator YiaG